MTSCAVLCVVLFGVASTSSSSLRSRRQMMLPQFPQEPVWGRPNRPFDGNRDFDFVFNFPGEELQSGGNPNGINNFNPNGFRPNRRRTTTTRTTTNRPGGISNVTPTTAGTDNTSSTPRTIHLVPEGCNCPSTPQFNPVCGTDGNTYKNAGLLNCFRRCGIDVAQRRMGSC